MKKPISTASKVYILILFLFTSCSSRIETVLPIQATSPPPPTLTTTSIPPTSTSTPLTPTSTFTPSPEPDTSTPEPTFTTTALPGTMVLPVDTLGEAIPWLPLDESARPVVNYVGFNVLRPPFNNALVRRAFAHAIDRQVLVEMAARYYVPNPKPATTLIPPETLGRDLYNSVGAGFDPQKARSLLTEAGYTDPSVFPTATIIVNAYGDTAPGARYNMANAMAEMWKANLGVEVKVEVIASFKEYGARLRSTPPEMFWQGWAADVNDPDNFLREIFHSDSEYNFGRFANRDFDKLVDTAVQSKNASERQVTYIQAERLLCESEAALIPLYHSNANLP